MRYAWLALWILAAGFFGYHALSRPDTRSLPTTAASLPASPPVAAPPTKNIEAIGLGERVVGRNPLREEVDERLPDPDPKTWRKLTLRMTKSDGGRLDIGLLRPVAWLEAARAAPGATIRLDLPELGAVGPAEVVSVSACPPIRPGDGNVVTGTFAHSASNVIDLHVDSLSTPIGCTANHPFWSDDRQAFIPAGDLRQGERLRTHAGDTLRVSTLLPRPGPQPVFNLEIDTEHVYHVTSAGLLVHNSCGVKYHYTDSFFESFKKKGLWTGSSVTDTPSLTAAQAVKQLGLKRPPTRIIVIRDRNHFRPNNPPVVKEHPLGAGGGLDFTNDMLVPPWDIIEEIPIPK